MKEDETLFPLWSGGADSSSSSSSSSIRPLTQSERQQVLDLWSTRGAAAVWEGRAFPRWTWEGSETHEQIPSAVCQKSAGFPT